MIENIEFCKYLYDIIMAFETIDEGKIGFEWKADTTLMHFTLDDVTFVICENFPLSFNDFKTITDILFDLLEIKK